MAALMLAVLGCGDLGTTASSSCSAPISAASLGPVLSGPASSMIIGRNPDGTFTIDAGIVFAGKPNYLCFPLALFGIESSDEVEAIATSCECVQASIIRFRSVLPGVDNALRFNIFSEANEGILEPVAMRANVLIHRKRKDRIEIALDFLETRDLGVTKSDDLSSGLRSMDD